MSNEERQAGAEQRMAVINRVRREVAKIVKWGCDDGPAFVTDVCEAARDGINEALPAHAPECDDCHMKDRR